MCFEALAWPWPASSPSIAPASPAVPNAPASPAVPNALAAELNNSFLQLNKRC